MPNGIVLNVKKTKTQPHGVVLKLKKTKTLLVDFNSETDTKASTSTLNRENENDRHGKDRGEMPSTQKKRW